MKSPIFYTISDVQKMLQVKSPGTVYNYIDRGKLPYHQIGKFRRFTEEDIQIFLKRCKPTLDKN